MIVVKKYANRRLYDTDRSCYITQAELASMIRSGAEIQVVDARSGADLTRLTLIQIILEIETDGHQMLPTEALRLIIRAYGGRNELLLSRYLERTMAAFARHYGDADKFLDGALDSIRDQADPERDAVSGDDRATLGQLREEMEKLRARLERFGPH
jgi:polyhydroxyalkanoate synthesis repressor PhaR